jgi:hypothetical protein
MVGVGATVGLPLRGLIADNLDFHALYWVGVVGSAVSLVLIVLFVSDAETRARKALDQLGVLLLVGGLVSLVLGLSEGNAWGWTSPTMLVLLVGGALLLVLLVLVERRAADPFVNLRARLGSRSPASSDTPEAAPGSAAPPRPRSTPPGPARTSVARLRPAPPARCCATHARRSRWPDQAIHWVFSKRVISREAGSVGRAPECRQRKRRKARPRDL